MYMTVRRYKVDPGSADEVISRAKEGLLPILRQASGFLAFYEINQGDGVIASVSLYQQRGDADEANIVAADWVKENLASLLPTPPETTTGEVVFHAEGRQRAA